MITYQDFVKQKGFGVGSVVRIINVGRIYTTYERAFKYFGILKYAIHSGCHSYQFYTLDAPKNYENKTFIIRGIVQHECCEDYLCCLACVEDRTFCVVGYRGIGLHPKKHQPKIVEDYEIKKIEKYY